MKNKTIYIRILLASAILSIFIISVYVYLTNIKNGEKKHKFNTQPQITVNYTSATLESIKKTNGYYYFNKENNEILEYFDDDVNYNIIGKYGKIYDSPIKLKEKETNENDGYEENRTFGNYTIKTDEEDGLDYLEDNKGNKSRKYKYIYSIYYVENDIFKSDYLALESDNTVILFNYKTTKETNLNAYYDDLCIYSNTTQNGNYKNYIIASTYDVNDEDEKYGLIDYDGNVILDLIYDDLVNYKNDDAYIASKNNKYGIINSKGEIIEDFIYEYIYNYYNYTIFVKNNKIGIKYNDKLIVDYTIQYSDSNNYTLDYDLIDGNLYLFKRITSNKNSQTYWNKSVVYRITKKGIDKTLENNLETITSYDENDDEIKYFYKVSENNNKLLITIYDTYLIEYYSFSIPYQKAYDYNIEFSKYNNSEIYELYLSYDVEGVKHKYYYIDLFNSKMIKEKDALITYLKNGYSFVLDNDNKLTIYKKDEIIAEFNNIEYYLGDYYFASENEIFKLVFKTDYK